MKRTRTTSPWLVAWLFVGLISASFTRPSYAQNANEVRKQTGFAPYYDAAHESSINGTVQQVIIKHEAGVPPGLHLLVAGSQGIVDAHLGPFIDKETKAALVTGMPIQIVGANVTIRNKQYLLAREITMGGHNVTIRSKHGVLALVQNTGTRHTRAVKTTPEVAGGAQ